MFSKIATFASLALFVTAATGCAAAADGTSASDDALIADGLPRADEFVFDGKFKLYDELTAVDPACDVHTVLDLKTKGGQLTANLNDAVEGTCKILLDETVR